jgi:NAD-dependent dihydropyrimidine dehydrogenase PreA subunit
MAQRVYAIPNIATPNRPVINDAELCLGCNGCVEVCPIDVFIPAPEVGAPPIILHPEECWYCEGIAVGVDQLVRTWRAGPSTGWLRQAAIPADVCFCGLEFH